MFQFKLLCCLQVLLVFVQVLVLQNSCRQSAACAIRLSLHVTGQMSDTAMMCLSCQFPFILHAEESSNTMTGHVLCSKWRGHLIGNEFLQEQVLLRKNLVLAKKLVQPLLYFVLSFACQRRSNSSGLWIWMCLVEKVVLNVVCSCLKSSDVTLLTRGGPCMRVRLSRAFISSRSRKACRRKACTSMSCLRRPSISRV